jgi:hypothetical protein
MPIITPPTVVQNAMEDFIAAFCNAIMSPTM